MVGFKMIQIKQKSLVEVCPQCCKSVDSSANRLVHDTCGHLKCRICLLQEITGCLLCLAESKSAAPEEPKNSIIVNPEPQQRKSVITSLAIQIAEQKQKQDPKSLPVVDRDTCHLIKQSMEKDILFPTEIVKRSTGNFYHLKRVFSQRFFSESNSKKHKACETEEKWSADSLTTDKVNKCDSDISEKKTWKVPNHVQVHYYCKVHDTTTVEKSNILRHHMSCGSDAESGRILHLCKICNKSYKIIGKLNRHMKIHLKNSKFKCMSCGKLCTDNYALKAHERTHSHQKPYCCQYCCKKFSSLQNFKRHEKNHRNEKNFVCDECGFRFITRTELKRHGITHTNVKSFSCSVCSSKFAFKRTLVRHLKTHDRNLLRIKCSLCDSTFRRKDNLERHIKTAHYETKSEKSEKLKEEVT